MGESKPPDRSGTVFSLPARELFKLLTWGFKTYTQCGLNKKINMMLSSLTVIRSSVFLLVPHDDTHTPKNSAGGMAVITSPSREDLIHPSHWRFSKKSVQLLQLRPLAAEAQQWPGRSPAGSLWCSGLCWSTGDTGSWAAASCWVCAPRQRGTGRKSSRPASSGRPRCWWGSRRATCSCTAGW